MNQIKYSAYALVLVIGMASLALFFTNFSSSPSHYQQPATTTVEEPPTKKAVVRTEGQNLFEANCQTCHSLTKNLTGPALAGIESRGPWTDRKMLLKWIKNPSAIINTDAYAKKLFQQYNGQLMPGFAHLSDEQIEAILNYIKEDKTTPVPTP